jgi:hypothetical protein
MAGKPDGNHRGVRYFSCLVRLWREDLTNNRWRASLEHADTDSRIGFPSLEALFDYLRQKTEAWANGEYEKEVRKEIEQIDDHKE